MRRKRSQSACSLWPSEEQSRRVPFGSLQGARATPNSILASSSGPQTQLEEALRLYNPEQHRTHALLYGVDPAVGAGVYAAWTLWCLGHPDQSLAKSHEALALARQMAHHYTLAVALCHCALLHQFRRDVQPTEELSEALMALSTEQGFAYWPAVAVAMRGWALAERGQGEAGIAELRSAMATIRAIGTAAELPWYLALLAGAHGIVGQTAEGLDAIAEALALVASTNERFYEAEIYRVKGELLLKHSGSDTAAEAESCFRQALDISRVQSAKSWELRAATSLARLWRDQGRAGRGPRSARPRLRLVHRGVRHRRPEGGQGTARRASLRCRLMG